MTGNTPLTGEKRSRSVGNRVTGTPPKKKIKIGVVTTDKSTRNQFATFSKPFEDAEVKIYTPSRLKVSKNGDTVNTSTPSNTCLRRLSRVDLSSYGGNNNKDHTIHQVCFFVVSENHIGGNTPDQHKKRLSTGNEEKHKCVFIPQGSLKRRDTCTNTGDKKRRKPSQKTVMSNIPAGDSNHWSHLLSHSIADCLGIDSQKRDNLVSMRDMLNTRLMTRFENAFIDINEENDLVLNIMAYLQPNQFHPQSFSHAANQVIETIELVTPTGEHKSVTLEIYATTKPKDPIAVSAIGAISKDLTRGFCSENYPPLNSQKQNNPAGQPPSQPQPPRPPLAPLSPSYQGAQNNNMHSFFKNSPVLPPPPIARVLSF